MKNKKKQFNQNGFIINEFKDKKILLDIRKTIKKHFTQNDKFYCMMDIKKFHAIAYKCQKEINSLNIQERFHLSEKNLIKNLIGNDTPMYESIIFLRVVRPIKKVQGLENPGFHRETFYSDHEYIKYAVNIWFPVINAGKKSTIMYIPKSHKINDKLIKRKRVKLKNNPIKKFSNGHKLGFFYSPKKIISGLNLDNQKKMIIPNKSYSFFSSMLVHGNGKNLTNKLRFAIGFGFVPKSKLVKNKIIDQRRFGTQKQKLWQNYLN